MRLVSGMREGGRGSAHPEWPPQFKSQALHPCRSMEQLLFVTRWMIGNATARTSTTWGWRSLTSLRWDDLEAERSVRLLTLFLLNRLHWWIQHHYPSRKAPDNEVAVVQKNSGSISLSASAPTNVCQPVLNSPPWLLVLLDETCGLY